MTNVLFLLTLRRLDRNHAKDMMTHPGGLMNNKRKTFEVEKARRSAGSRVLLMLLLSAMAMPSSGLAVQRWIRHFSGQYGQAVCPARNGGCIVAAEGDFAMLALRVDSLGDSLWATASIPNVTPRSVLPVDDSSWMVIGDYAASRSDSTGPFFEMVTESGRTLWLRKFCDTSLFTNSFAWTTTSDSGYLTAGRAKGWDSTIFHGYAVRFDRNGGLVWERRYRGLMQDVFNGCVHSRQGGFLMAGTSTSSADGRERGWFVRIDEDGDTLWTQTYDLGANCSQDFECVRQTSDGGYIAAGGVSTDVTEADFLLVKTDSLGNMEWYQTYGGPDCDCALGACIAPDGGFVLTGQTRSYGSGDFDLWLVKTDSFGNMQWSRAYGGQNWDQGNDVQPTPDSGYIVTGQFTSDPVRQVYLIKTDANGIGAGITEGPASMRSPAGRAVSIRATPTVLNRGLASVTYEVSTSGPVEAALYDESGRRAALLAHGYRTAGEHTESFILPEMKGVSFLRITTPTGSAAAKLVVISP
jgi:hypothetical protein